MDLFSPPNARGWCHHFGLLGASVVLSASALACSSPANGDPATTSSPTTSTISTDNTGVYPTPEAP
jgi:hypothetical protein